MNAASMSHTGMVAAASSSRRDAVAVRAASETLTQMGVSSPDQPPPEISVNVVYLMGLAMVAYTLAIMYGGQAVAAWIQ